MPSKNPRVVLTLEPALYDTIKRLGAFQRIPMSRVVHELLREVQPMLEGTVAALEETQRAKGKPAAALVTAMTRMQGAVEQLAQEVTGQLDFLRAEKPTEPGAGVPAQRSVADTPRRSRAKPRRKAPAGRKRSGRT